MANFEWLSIGYVIVPVGYDRMTYMEECTRNGTVDVLRDAGGCPAFNVKIPANLIPELYFPDAERSEFLGSPVVLGMIPRTNTPVVMAVLNTLEEMPQFNAIRKGITVNRDTITAGSSILVDDSSINATVATNEADKTSSIKLMSIDAQGTASIDFETNVMFTQVNKTYSIVRDECCTTLLAKSEVEEDSAPMASFFMNVAGDVGFLAQKSIKLQNVTIDPSIAPEEEDYAALNSAVELNVGSITMGTTAEKNVVNSMLMDTAAKTITVSTFDGEDLSNTIIVDGTAKSITVNSMDGGEVKNSLVMDSAAPSITLTSKEDNSVTIDGAGGKVIVAAKDGVDLGTSGTEPAVLGETLVGVLKDLISAITSITVPTAFGPSGTPVNAADFSSIESSLNDILSDLVKVGMK